MPNARPSLKRRPNASSLRSLEVSMVCGMNVASFSTSLFHSAMPWTLRYPNPTRDGPLRRSGLGAAADRAVLFKTGAKEIGHRHGIMPSFMAKWRQDLPGRLLCREDGAGVPAARARHVRAAGPSRRLSVSRRGADPAVRQRRLHARVGQQLAPQRVEPGRVHRGEVAAPAQLPEFRTLDGAFVSPAQLHGKVTVVALFSVTCPFCMNEAPKLQRLHHATRSSNCRPRIRSDARSARSGSG